MNLDELRDSESCLTRLSYAGIIRYAATGNRKSVSHALSQLQRLHAIQISRGMRIGITRESSAYRVTLDDLRFLELCNEVHSSGRAQIAQERAYRLELRRKEKKKPATRVQERTARRS